MATGTQIVGEAKRKLKQKSLRPEIVYKMRKNKAGTLIRGPGTAGGAGGAGGAANMRPEKDPAANKTKSKGTKTFASAAKTKKATDKKKTTPSKKTSNKTDTKKTKKKVTKTSTRNAALRTMTSNTAYRGRKDQRFK